MQVKFQSIAIIFVACWGRIATANPVEPTWLVYVRVVDNPPNPIDAAFVTAPSPWIDQHSVSARSMVSQAAYRFVWSQLDASFHIDGSQQAPGGPFVQAQAFGTIYISPTVDILAHIDASYAYHLGGGDREASIGVSIRRTDTQQALYDDGRSAIAIIGDPRNGTLAFGGQAFLGAGLTYFMQYEMELGSYSGSASSLSSATGAVDLRLDYLPEPSAAAPLALAALALLRRGRA